MVAFFIFWQLYIRLVYCVSRAKKVYLFRRLWVYLEYNLGLRVGSHWITYVVLARASLNGLSPVVPLLCLLCFLWLNFHLSFYRFSQNQFSHWCV